MKNLNIRWKVVILATIFIVPYLAAWVYYSHGKSWRQVTTNYGQLLSPVLALNQFNLQFESGDVYPYKNLLGKWTMLYVADDNCDKQCQDNIYKMRQIRLVLRKEMQRINLSLATTEPLTSQMNQTIAKNYQDLQHFMLNKNNNLVSGVYLVDPKGNIFMRYQPNCQPTAIYEDLQHVLKVSQIG